MAPNKALKAKVAQLETQLATEIISPGTSTAPVGHQGNG